MEFCTSTRSAIASRSLDLKFSIALCEIAQQWFGWELGFSLWLLIRVKCHHKGGFGVVIEHGGRICDVVYPVVTVDR